MDALVVTAEMIDSFQVPNRNGANYVKRECQFTNCKRAGVVKLFYTDPKEANQQKASVCVNHAADLANNVLLKYKFGR